MRDRSPAPGARAADIRPVQGTRSGNRARAAFPPGLQQKEFDRYTALVAQQSASQQELDRVEAAYRAAKARVAEVEALRATKGAQLNTTLAQVEQAKVNINDCKLNAPFTGQIARVHVIPGGYVFPGQAVVTLQMMDPLKVDIAISPARDARINYNDLVRVYAPTGDELEGYVYLKDTFADPATRTFLVTLLVRNKKIRVGVPDEMEGKGIAECRNLWKLDKPDIDGPGNYYAEVKAIHQDDQGYFVWKVENLTQDQLFEDFDPVLTVKKVRVTPHYPSSRSTAHIGSSGIPAVSGRHSGCVTRCDSDWRLYSTCLLRCSSVQRTSSAAICQRCHRLWHVGICAPVRLWRNPDHSTTLLDRSRRRQIDHRAAARVGTLQDRRVRRRSLDQIRTVRRLLGERSAHYEGPIQLRHDQDRLFPRRSGTDRGGESQCGGRAS